MYYSVTKVCSNSSYKILPLGRVFTLIRALITSNALAGELDRISHSWNRSEHRKFVVTVRVCSGLALRRGRTRRENERQEGSSGEGEEARPLKRDRKDVRRESGEL